MAAGAKIDAELAWAMVKMGRMQRARHVELTGHAGVRLHFNVPDLVQRELMLIDQQLAGQLLSDEDVLVPDHQRERFIVSALQDEAIASSMLEGAATTRRDAEILLRTNKEPKSTGERMVVNNYRAIEFIRETRDVSLSPDYLLVLQELLTRGTLENDDGVGRFRTDRDEISVVDDRDNQVMHRPPPASELDERLERLCKFANQTNRDHDFVHPVIRACILHFQLGFDHPFCDGNGRTARALFYWMMLKENYWLFELISISRLIYHGPSKYQRAFLYCENDAFDVTYFLVYKARIIARARQELQDYIRTEQRKVATARKLFSADRRLNSRQQRLVLRAVRNPEQVFTIAGHQASHKVSYSTAYGDLQKLVKWGYLKTVVVGNRFDFYPTDQLFDADRAH